MLNSDLRKCCFCTFQKVWGTVLYDGYGYSLQATTVHSTVLQQLTLLGGKEGTVLQHTEDFHYYASIRHTSHHCTCAEGVLLMCMHNTTVGSTMVSGQQNREMHRTVTLVKSLSCIPLWVSNSSSTVGGVQVYQLFLAKVVGHESAVHFGHMPTIYCKRVNVEYTQTLSTFNCV